MIKDMKTMIKIHSYIYEIMIGNSHLSNGVNNIPINSGSTTSMTQRPYETIEEMKYKKGIITRNFP